MPDEVTCDLWVVIPTYWGNPEAGIFDHPTPINGKSTLPALLDSLVDQDYQSQYNVLVLVASDSDDLSQLATSRVEEVIAKYSSKLNLSIANQKTAEKLDADLKSSGLDLRFGSFQNYASVRNLQLLVPAALGAKTIIALDDDELVSTDYLRKATGKIGKQICGKEVVALAGPYLDDSGSPFLREPSRQTNLLLDKAILMNQTMRRLCMNPDVLVPSSMAFGGNMIFHRDLFSEVGFDPGITRGEDIDYLINSRIAGFQFYFDPSLTILHRPPRHYEAPMYAKLRGDVIRFQYEYEKISHFDINARELMPYPGELLTEEFRSIALDALRRESTTALVDLYGAPEEIMAYSSKRAKRKLCEYNKFRSQWPIATRLLSEEFSSSDVYLLPNE